ncbi:MAG: BMP family ABC transporter substrate-binding protein [Candidatus Limnocylindrales bacterium]
MSRSKTRIPWLAGVCAASTVLLAGCSLFSSGPVPTATGPAGPSSPGTTISTETATPSPTPQLVKSITLVAAIGEPKDSTPAGLTWSGVQSAGTQVGATTALVQPVSNADLPTAVEQASTAPGAVVVTVGPNADPSVEAAAADHPATQFVEMDVVVPDSAPANVHGLVFDEAEAGYIGGYVAASFASTGKIGFVGDTSSDASSTNYRVGFAAGATEARPEVSVTFGFVGTSDSPDKGRAAAAVLVKGGDTVILAMPSLSGIGALREACTRGAGLVAVDTDAWQTVPDIQSCLIVSVMKRYDTAATAAILALASGRTVPAVTVNDVASGGIALSDFHATIPAGFQAGLDALMAALRAGPPRPTPAPSTAASAAQESPSPHPSGT